MSVQKLEKEASISKGNKTTVPVDVMDVLDLEPGDKFKFVIDEEWNVSIEPTK